MIEERLLRREERAVFALRGLYRKYGYLPFKMSKFEEYELYLRNKDFLVSDRIISFNDTNGSLMALKPDVTLSIIKNSDDIIGIKQKVCYNENVYRVSESTHRFKEIMQSGLECIGDIDLYDTYEVISLAAQSLALISSGFVLEISNLDVLGTALTEICANVSFKEEAIGYIAQKNAHDLRRLCNRFGISEENAQRLCCFTDTYGSRRDAIHALRENFGNIEASELIALSDMLDASPYSEHICFDFSSVNDMNYYNGFVFKGYLDGVCDSVLAGGQYDKMMSRMQRKSGAIGFALYLDMLEQLGHDEAKSDVDILLLYDDIDSTAVAAKIQALIAVGLSVSAQKTVPDKLRYGKIIDMRKENALC